MGKNVTKTLNFHNKKNKNFFSLKIMGTTKIVKTLLNKWFSTLYTHVYYMNVDF